MNTTTRKIINHEVWEIVKITCCFWVVNTHEQDTAISGCTTPDFIKSFKTEDEAIEYLKKTFLNSTSN